MPGGLCQPPPGLLRVLEGRAQARGEWSAAGPAGLAAGPGVPREVASPCRPPWAAD